MEIKITGLTLASNPKPNMKGDVILAYFDAQVEWLAMKGAALVRLNSGGVTVWEPRLQDDRYGRAVRMEGAVRREVAAAALPLFEAMGAEVERIAADA